MTQPRQWMAALCSGVVLGCAGTAGANLLSIDIDTSGNLEAVHLDQDGNGSADLVVSARELGRVRMVDPLYLVGGKMWPLDANAPRQGFRAALLDGDHDIDTGFADVRTLTLAFPRGCTNGPGSDIVLIEVADGDDMSVTINGTTVDYLAGDFTTGLTGDRGFSIRSSSSGDITSVAELDSTALGNNSGWTDDRAGIGIDLDDFGVGAGVVVTGLTVTSSDALDPMFVGTVYPAEQEASIVSIGRTGTVLTSVTLDQDGDGTADLTRNSSAFGDVILVDPLHLEEAATGYAMIAPLLNAAPPEGQRAALIDRDDDLDTGMVNIVTNTFAFLYPATNGPGADIVLFDNGDGDHCRVAVNGRTVNYAPTHFTTNLLGGTTGVYVYELTGSAVSNIVQLESATFSHRGGASMDRAGLSIDLDLFEVPAGGSVTNVQVVSPGSLDLMFIGSIYGQPDRGKLFGITADAGNNLQTVTLDVDGDGSGDTTVNEADLGRITLVDPLWLQKAGVGFGEILCNTVPPDGQRAALLDGDADLDTGLANIRLVTIEFVQPAENRDGIDIVIFDLGAGDDVDIGMAGITNTYAAADFTTGLLAADMSIKTYRSTPGSGDVGPITSVAQLATNAFYHNFTGSANAAGLGIDLSDYRVRPGETVTTMQLVNTGLFDPLYIGVVHVYTPPPSGTAFVIK